MTSYAGYSTSVTGSVRPMPPDDSTQRRRVFAGAAASSISSSSSRSPPPALDTSSPSVARAARQPAIPVSNTAVVIKSPSSLSPQPMPPNTRYASITSSTTSPLPKSDQDSLTALVSEKSPGLLKKSSSNTSISRRVSFSPDVGDEDESDTGPSLISPPPLPAVDQYFDFFGAMTDPVPTAPYIPPSIFNHAPTIAAATRVPPNRSTTLAPVSQRMKKSPLLASPISRSPTKHKITSDVFVADKPDADAIREASRAVEADRLQRRQTYAFRQRAVLEQKTQQALELAAADPQPPSPEKAIPVPLPPFRAGGVNSTTSAGSHHMSKNATGNTCIVS